MFAITLKFVNFQFNIFTSYYENSKCQTMIDEIKSIAQDFKIIIGKCGQCFFDHIDMCLYHYLMHLMLSADPIQQTFSPNEILFQKASFANDTYL